MLVATILMQIVVDPIDSDLVIRRLTWIVGASVALEYGVTSIHHVVEGLGLVFGFRLRSLIVPVTFSIPLLITLALLYLYQKTRSRIVLGFTGATAIVWWVVGIGLIDGFYNHTLTVVLYLSSVPAGIVGTIYPTYRPTPTTATIPCDGVQYSYCSLTVATLVYEIAGIASFVIACFLTLNLYRLIRAGWGRRSLAATFLPRGVATVVSVGMVAALGTTPTLGTYMSTGRPMALATALSVMCVGIASTIYALARVRRPGVQG